MILIDSLFYLCIQDANGDVISSAIHALHRVFTDLIDHGMLDLDISTNSSTKEAKKDTARIAADWLKRQYDLFVQACCDLIKKENTTIKLQVNKINKELRNAEQFFFQLFFIKIGGTHKLLSI